LGGLILVLSGGAAAKDKKEKLIKVEETKQGFYRSLVLGNQLSYYVDTVAQLCYCYSDNMQSNTFVVIPCENLKKRPEWAGIITWVD
jgi:hypothetical protein